MDHFKLKSVPWSVDLKRSHCTLQASSMKPIVKKNNLGIVKLFACATDPLFTSAVILLLLLNGNFKWTLGKSYSKSLLHNIDISCLDSICMDNIFLTN